MTARGSCKFREYFLYRLGKLKGCMILSFILSLLVLPYSAYGVKCSSIYIFSIVNNNEAAHIGGYFDFIATLGGAALVVMALVGAPLAFDIFNRRSKTDLFGALPLTHAERFWGDFLGGWLANVAPIIPAGIIAVLMSIDTQKLLNAANIKEGYTEPVQCVRFFVGVSLSLLAACTVCYIVGTLAAVCCGRLGTSVLMSLLSAGFLTLVCFGTSLCANAAAVGVRFGSMLNVRYMRIFPALGALYDIRENFSVLGAADFSVNGLSGMFINSFMVFEPLYILYTAVFAAGLAVLAFFLSKRRGLEKTGSVFAYTVYFRVVLVIAMAGAFLVTFGTSLFYQMIPSVWVNFGLALFVSAVAALVMELIRRPKARELPKTILAFEITAACCMGVYALINATGAFGARYVSSEGVERVEIEYSFYRRNCELTITDKDDIKTLVDLTNDMLREHHDKFETGYDYKLIYIKTDGTSELREYSTMSKNKALMARLIDNTRALPTFPESMADEIERISDQTAIYVELDGVYGGLRLNEDETEDYAQKRDTLQKYSPRRYSKNILPMTKRQDK